MTLSEASLSKIITITTDFGYSDPFVGQMKGIILSINPEVKIVDITHEIESHCIEDASFVLYNSYKYFPEGTIHVVVVDPGVGSSRRAIIIQTDGHYFVMPDNGLISYVVKNKPFKAIKIENKRYILKEKSSTFHGRDVFAPVAAWLSKGLNIEEFGSEIENPVVFPIQEPEIKSVKGKRKIKGRIIYIDKFGNAITNIGIKHLQEIYNLKDISVIKIKIGRLYLPIVKCYSESPNKPAALINSDDYIEIFVYKNRASKILNLSKNKTVQVIIDG
jgi:S-adenosylmethionine hydrolase